MPDDPFQTRRRGIRRVRVVTASLAAASVAGTGAIALAVATPAVADETGTPATVQSDGSGGVTQPATPPTHGSGRGHASSGGS